MSGGKRKIRPSPGPWSVARSLMGDLEPFDGDDRHLLSSEGDNPLPLHDREANGRLIECAPDLLHYVREWVTAPDDYDGRDLARARALIAYVDGTGERPD